MKLRYKWICGLISVSLLSTAMTACSYPWSFLSTQKKEETTLETPGFAAGTPRGRHGQEETERETETESSVQETENAENAVPLPERFDYREWGRCPAVGSQGDLGTCWAFATMIALESSILPEEAWDFSEDHISLHNSFGMSQDMGGDYTMAMAYLLAWQGPVREEDDPYGDGESPEGLEVVKHVQEVQIPEPKDYDAIKRAVYFHGGVQTSLYMGMENEDSVSEFYKEETCSYYYNGSETSNHDIVIVGWDDAYPRENFSYEPGRDGAFICVNSWGSEFGEQGLFYVSYEDANVGKHNLVYTGVENSDNYDAIYQSDLCGWLGQLGYGDESAYFANVYEAKADESLEAVGFYATGKDTEYEVYAIGNVGEGENLRLGKRMAKGRFSKMGFYTIRLAEPVKLKEGERFAVAVLIRTPGAIHPVAIEYQGDGHEVMAQVDVSDGEGYISADGHQWVRAETDQGSNICLKAYTRRK